jgi:hypothetical protein
LENRLAFGFALVLAIWLIGGIFYYKMEHFSLVDSFYFAATTLTTVGFGDLHPKTTIGKVFTVWYVFVGLGLVLYVLTQVGRYYLDRTFTGSQRLRNRNPNKHIDE